MLRVTTDKKKSKTVVSVEGRLVGQNVATLEQCWRELRSASPQEKFYVNLCGVSFIDGAGKMLLKTMYHEGSQLIADGCLNQAIVKEIVGEEKNGLRSQSSHEKKTPIIFYLLLFGLLMSGSGVRAQQPASLPGANPGGKLKLTLDRAVGLALKQNPTAQIAVLQAAEAAQDKNTARAGLLPQADLQTYDAVRRSNIEAQLGINFPGVPQHIGPINIFNAGPTFGMPVFDLNLWNRYRSAKSGANASRQNSLSTREQVILLVVSQYIGTLRAMATVEAASSRVELAQALYDQAADLQKEGVGTGIDTLRANVELQNEKQRLLEAENDRETSLYGLSRLLNLDPRQKIELADSLSFFETPQPEVQASIEEAMASRQEWKALASQIKAAENQKKAAQFSRLPSVRFDGEFAYVGNSGSTTLPTYTYEASVNLPLFTGGRIHAEVVSADLEIRKLEEQSADLRNQIALDVKTSLLNLDSARSEVQVANLGVQLSKEE